MDNQAGTSHVTVGSPVADIGENRYLTHYTSEILVGDELAGYALFTRYAYARAAEDRIPIQWMIKPDSYMRIVEDLLINQEARFTALPLMIEESIDDTKGTVAILDEITCKPDHFSKEVYSEAIRQLVEYFRHRVDGILINDPRPLARYLNGIYTSPEVFWTSFGFDHIDNKNYVYSAIGAVRKAYKHQEAD